MGPSPWPSWNAQSHGHLHEGRPSYIHTYIPGHVLWRRLGSFGLLLGLPPIKFDKIFLGQVVHPEKVNIRVLFPLEFLATQMTFAQTEKKHVKKSQLVKYPPPKLKSLIL